MQACMLHSEFNTGKRKREILKIEEKRKIIQELKIVDATKIDITAKFQLTIHNRIGMEKNILVDTIFPRPKMDKTSESFRPGFVCENMV